MNILRPVLGIETSCDETAVAIVTAEKKILCNLVLSQTDHLAFGGVVPEIAARAHLDHLDTMVKEALHLTALTFKELGGIAVTAGPGLIGGVLVGAMMAKAIAAVHRLPIVAVNHLEGHALTVRLTDDVDFPYLLLLASGGHCQLLNVEGVGRYHVLGGTLDDAIGEAFDKTAKILGLGYPGGPALEKMAALCQDPIQACKDFVFPEPMVGKPQCDFSFSGLKTAARRRAQDLLPEQQPAFCFAFQETIARIVVDRVRQALKQTPDVPTLVVAGGVAANRRLRAALEQTASSERLRFVAPPIHLCTDNAAMIAWAGVERLRLGYNDSLDFPVFPRWPLESKKFDLS